MWSANLVADWAVVLVLIQPLTIATPTAMLLSALNLVLVEGNVAAAAPRYICQPFACLCDVLSKCE